MKNFKDLYNNLQTIKSLKEFITNNKWKAIKTWKTLCNGEKINREEAQNFYKYIRYDLNFYIRY